MYLGKDEGDVFTALNLIMQGQFHHLLEVVVGVRSADEVREIILCMEPSEDENKARDFRLWAHQLRTSYTDSFKGYSSHGHGSFKDSLSP